jgi:hypothetical protein
LSNDVGKAFEGNGFDHVVAVCACIIAQTTVTFLLGVSEDYDRDEFEERSGLDLAQHLEPIHARHFEIQENHMRKGILLAVGEFASFKRKTQRFLPIFKSDDLVRQIVFF